MSKNLTRKGLAFGAILSLGAAAFAGTPAYAVSEITIAPSAGTLYNTLSASSFTLKTDISVTAGTAAKLKYKVANAGARAITSSTENAANGFTLTADNGVKAFDGTTAVAVGAAGNGTFSGTEQIITPAEAGTTAASNLLKLSNGYRDADVSVTVQAWIDENSNGLVDSTEFATAVQTVKFVKNSNVAATTTLTAPVLGGGTLSADVVLADINMQQVAAADVRVTFKKNGTAITSFANAVDANTDGNADGATAAIAAGTATTGNAANTTYGSSKLSATFTPTNVTAEASGAAVANDALVIAANATYTAVASLNNGTTYDDAGVAAGSTPVAGTIVVDGVAAPALTAGANAQSTNVRTGTKSVQVKAAVTKAGPVAIDAGVKAQIVVTKVALTGTNTITVNGKTLTSADTSITADAVTDADGKVVFNLESNTGAKDTSVSIVVKALSTTGWVAGNSTTFLYADATAAGTVTELSSIGNEAELTAVKGSTYSLTFDARDSFGAPLSATNYRVAVSINGTGNTSGAAFTYYPLVSGGKATVSIVDNSAVAGKYTVDAALQYLNTSNTWVSGTGTDSVVVNITAAAPVVSSVSATASVTTGVALETATIVAHDLRLDANSKTEAGIARANSTTITGTVASATGAGVAGVPVTITSAGAWFAVANGANTNAATYTIGSATVYTNSSGGYSVIVSSQKAGDNIFKVTAGGVSATDVKIAYAFPTTANKDSKLSVSGVSTTKAGRTNNFVIALTDKYGNAIKGAIAVSIAQSGAGYLASVPATVSAVDGKANVTLITGANDGGLATLTVTYDVAASDTDVVVSKSVLVGVSATVSAGSKKANVVVKNASGLTVKVVSGSKVTSKTATSDSYKLSLTKLTAGKKTVKVYVNDVLVLSKSVTVKR